MKTRTGQALIIVGLCIALFFSALQAAPSEPAWANASAAFPDVPPAPQIITIDSDIKVLASSDQRITLEYTTPAHQFVELHDEAGECHLAQIAGYAQTDRPGEPQLPIRSFLLGIPIDADVLVTILEYEADLLPDPYYLCPVPSRIAADPHAIREPQEVPDYRRIADTARYTSRDWLPAEFVGPASTGFIRNQRLARIGIHPIQYQPASGRIRILRKATVLIEFHTDHLIPQSIPSTVSLPDPSMLHFEDGLRQSLLNYEDARHWRLSPLTGDPGPVDNTAPHLLAVSDPVFLLSVKEAGIYRVTGADLLLANPALDLGSLVTDNIQLFNQGQEVAIYVEDGGDNTFDAHDAIIFYGAPITSKYTDENIYWLTSGAFEGLRMESRDGKSSGAPSTSNSFTNTLHLEENRIYLSGYPSGDDDRWYWEVINAANPTRQYTFDLPLLAESPRTATFRGLIRGYGANPNHSMVLYLNGQMIHQAFWESSTPYAFSQPIDPSWLIAGQNVITITGGIGVILDTSLVNWFAVDYQHRYIATGNLLHFQGETSGHWRYSIGDISENTITLWDVTDPVHPAQILDFDITETSGPYTATFDHQSTESHSYVLNTPDTYANPYTVTPGGQPWLRSQHNGADYIIISHSKFITTAQPLMDLRASQGLRVQLIDVQDIYDEFNYGIVDPDAIKNFLQFAYDNWQRPAPHYVLLLGDGNFDPLNYMGFGEPSYIPPYLADVDPWTGETAADNRYVCVSGNDTLPDMHLGRLPARTVDEASAMINKIVNYRQPATPQSWQAQVLFVADNADQAGDFAALSDIIVQNHLPAPYASSKIYYAITHITPTSARNAIRAAIDNGVLAVNYIGHASSGQWANEGMLRRQEVRVLNNTGKLPLMVPMTCLDGYYIAPSSSALDYSAISEVGLRLEGKGAIASWSPTGLGLATGHDYLNRALFDAIFKEDIIELGPATTYAKLYLYANSGGQYLDLLDTYLLFGDPATRLNVLPVDLQLSKEVVGHTGTYAAGETITYRLTYTNAGPATARRVVISDTLSTVLRNPVITSSGTPITPQAGSALVWDVADLVAGAGGVITITAEIGPHSGALVNAAAISTTGVESDPANNRAAVTTTVVAPDVRITKTVTPQSPLQPGDTLTYTLTFRNAGAAPARNVVIEDPVSLAHATVAVVSASGAPAVLRPGTRFVWDVGELPPGAAGALVLRATLGAAASGNVTNTASISTSSVESNYQNNISHTTVTVLVPDLAISKAAAPGRLFNPGEFVTYTLSFTNVGSIQADQVVITDIVPAKVLNPVVTASVPLAPRSGSAYVWDLGDIAPGGGGTITITGQLAPDYEGWVTNKAAIGTSSKEFNLANNTAQVMIGVAREFADVRITQRLTPAASLRSGDRIIFTLSYTNTGPAIARQVVITDALPSQVLNPTVQGFGPSATVRSGSRYIWDVGTLEAGEGGIITITGLLGPTHAGYTVTNVAQIGTVSVESDLDNNEASVTAQVGPRHIYMPLILRRP